MEGAATNGEEEVVDLGLLMLRLVVGLTLAAHGTQKLFGWFGGYGLAGTGGFMEQLGFRPGRRAAFMAGLATGVWDGLESLDRIWSRERRFDPAMDDALRERMVAGWRKAVERTLLA